MNDMRKWRRFWMVSNVVLFAAVLLLGQMAESWQGGLTKLIQFYNLMICGVTLVFFWRSDRYGRGIKVMLSAWVILGIDPDGCYAAGTLADGLGAALCAWLLYPCCADGNLYAGLVFIGMEHALEVFGACFLLRLWRSFHIIGTLS